MVNLGLVIQGIGTAVSILLTAALVRLYRIQTDLNRYEMDRDARKIHTDELRKRVRYWLDEENYPEGPETPDFLNTGSGRLPKVTRVTVRPASESIYARSIDEELEEFDVVPEKLQRDRYMDNFLQNHADNIDQLVTEITELQSEFRETRDEFFDACPQGKQVQLRDECLVEPIDGNYEQWFFERVILMERERIERDQLLENVEEGVVDTPGMGGEDHIKYRAEPIDSAPLVYKATFLKGDRQAFSDETLKQEVEPLIVDTLRRDIERIDDGEP